MRSKLVACLLAAGLAITGSAASALDMTERPDFKTYFDEAGTDGTIVIYNLATDRRFVYNRDRARKGFLPSSTFKILNSLIALETGAAKSVDDTFAPPAEPFTVDGKAILPPACNAAVTLKAAFQNSCIPAYQEIARRVGPERMAGYLREAGYGNAAIDGAPIDAFWLSGKLRVSAEEQVVFLEKLWREQLPFSRTTHRRVKDIMFVEETNQRILRGKSGYVFATSPEVGWWIGWTEHEGDAILFALNIDLTSPQHFAARLSIVKKILASAGV